MQPNIVAIWKWLAFQNLSYLSKMKCLLFFPSVNFRKHSAAAALCFFVWVEEEEEEDLEKKKSPSSVRRTAFNRDECKLGAQKNGSNSSYVEQRCSPASCSTIDEVFLEMKTNARLWGEKEERRAPLEAGEKTRPFSAFRARPFAKRGRRQPFKGRGDVRTSFQVQVSLS